MANAFIDKLSRNDRRQIARLLQNTFPDSPRDDEAITAFAASIWSYERQREQGRNRVQGVSEPDVFKIDLRPYGRELDAYLRIHQMSETQNLPRARDNARFYLCEAQHSRKPPLKGLADPFVGTLSMVRVTLPQSTPRTFHTSLGTVEPRDHLVSTVDEAQQKVPSHVGIERVDMITPPREGARFGAISVFLIYTSASSTIPSHFLLEAGTALGDAKVLYWGPEFEVPITRFCGYRPTPYSHKDNRYVGSLSLSGDNPKHLRIQASKALGGGQFSPHYIEVDVKFNEERPNRLQALWPGLLTAKAATLVLLRKPQLDARD